MNTNFVLVNIMLDKNRTLMKRGFTRIFYKNLRKSAHFRVISVLFTHGPLFKMFLTNTNEHEFARIELIVLGTK
jgi:hypothetical protein